MISWTITRPNVFTGQTTRVFSSNTLFSLTGTQDYGSTWIDSAGETTSSNGGSTSVTETAQSYGSSATIHGIQTSLTSFFNSYTYAYLSEAEGGGVTQEPSIVTSYLSESGITTASLLTVEQETSTVATEIHIYETTTTSVETTTVYTTDTLFNGQVTQTSFATSETEKTIVAPSTTSTTFTFYAVTTAAAAPAGDIRATIYKADPDEVIYYMSGIEGWSGYSAATDVAQSALEITVIPSYALAPYPFVSISDGSAVNNEDRSSFFSASSYSFNATTSATSAKTITRAVNFNALPNATTTQTLSVVTTRTTNITHGLFESYSFSAAAAEASTTSQKIASTRHSNNHGTMFEGSAAWNVLWTQTTSQIEILDTPVETGVVASSSFYLINNTSETYLFTSGESTDAQSFESTGLFQQQSEISSSSSSEEGIQKNMAAIRSPACSTFIADSNVMQRKFLPSGATLLASGGNYYSISDATTLPFYRAIDQRNRVTTVFPSSNESVSYSKNSVTYTASTLNTTTTKTALISVLGQTDAIATASEAIGIVGGYPQDGETFAKIVRDGGVFLNKQNGQTLTFDLGATTFTDSAQISVFERITAVSPPMGAGGYTATTILWTAPRNSTALPPINLAYA